MLRAKRLGVLLEHGFPNSLRALLGEKWINGVAQLLDPMTEAFLGKESWLSFTQSSSAWRSNGEEREQVCPGSSQGLRLCGIGKKWSKVLIQLHHALYSTNLSETCHISIKRDTHKLYYYSKDTIKTNVTVAL